VIARNEIEHPERIMGPTRPAKVELEEEAKYEATSLAVNARAGAYYGLRHVA
jgi:hypothetical protein